ncbi:YopX family protein [Aliarcobacter butzleri]|uniref:YopX family protein n=1 Tax=Aliarcobacter butzleri TaxID=28197 RepID=UPI0021B35C4B|nr:YopX family protein [Aliarcobacter butzleri]MCT7563328.1 YopX family protein [Aliarcobacter butzleri]MCT7578769.1 YopX family protein [Aliarcobacter butzleri]
MREIIFKGLSTKNKWVYGSLVITTNGLKHKPHSHTKTWIIESSFGNGGWFNILKREYVKPETVSEDTSLNDKKNNRIFENDIIFNYDDGKLYCVQMLKGCWFFVRLDNADIYINADFYKKYALVIGNICDKQSEEELMIVLKKIEKKNEYLVELPY